MEQVLPQGMSGGVAPAMSPRSRIRVHVGGIPARDTTARAWSARNTTTYNPQPPVPSASPGLLLSRKPSGVTHANSTFPISSEVSE
jgi:hypothetical protein